ncbi:MAG: carboxylating nicotinate-nucleotide diphosphorylase [Candidatus Marinimicrobia bacterium]|nr:carboxylating nicotinate-nucleotide diphosphorylase [Candidatus Neomarinimicrobiota bacterium]
MNNSRTEWIKNCFDASAELRVTNKYYRQTALSFFENLLAMDSSGGDSSQNPPYYYQQKCRAVIKAKSPAILAGLAEIQAFLHNKSLKCESEFTDGAQIQTGETVLTIHGRSCQILLLERTILNILQRLSGIATVTMQYTQAIADLPCFVTATRKTLWGPIDKSAIQYGGGLTHRIGLSDAAMLKENHLTILKKSGESQALDKAIAAIAEIEPPPGFIEVEVTNDSEFRKIVEIYKRIGNVIDRVIMFDHFEPENIQRLIETARTAGVYSQILFEASGNVTLETIRAYAESGVDVVSVGALTHSVKSADFSLLIVD